MLKEIRLMSNLWFFGGLFYRLACMQAVNHIKTFIDHHFTAIHLPFSCLIVLISFEFYGVFGLFGSLWTVDCGCLLVWLFSFLHTRSIECACFPMSPNCQIVMFAFRLLLLPLLPLLFFAISSKSLTIKSFSLNCYKANLVKERRKRVSKINVSRYLHKVISIFLSRHRKSTTPTNKSLSYGTEWQTRRKKNCLPMVQSVPSSILHLISTASGLVTAAKFRNTNNTNWCSFELFSFQFSFRLLFNSICLNKYIFFFYKIFHRYSFFASFMYFIYLFLFFVKFPFSFHLGLTSKIPNKINEQL